MGVEMKPGVATDPWMGWLDKSLEEWESAELLRNLRSVEPITSVHAHCEGRKLVLFSTNDYLGLSFHPTVRDAVAEAVRHKGMGPRGSALVCGHTLDHERLETKIAELKGMESALLFPTGYAANLSLLSSLADSDTTFFSDELNHASIIDGCRMAKLNGAEVKIYPHRDTESLERLLRDAARPKKLIVTDTVFSMEGDLAPVRELVRLKNEYEAWLLVDEAHGTLVFGENGGGVCESEGIASEVEIQMGTLSKALGSQGGYVASNDRLKQWLINRGRSFVFSTAIPIPSVVAALAALETVENEPAIRNRLWEWVNRFGKGLSRNLHSPIVPIVIGGNEEAMSLSQRLLETGYHVPGIRPPTVPKGTARLRVALSAAHELEDIEGLLDRLSKEGAAFNSQST